MTFAGSVFCPGNDRYSHLSRDLPGMARITVSQIVAADKQVHVRLVKAGIQPKRTDDKSFPMDSARMAALESCEVSFLLLHGAVTKPPKRPNPFRLPHDPKKPRKGTGKGAQKTGAGGRGNFLHGFSKWSSGDLSLEAAILLVLIGKEFEATGLDLEKKLPDVFGTSADARFFSHIFSADSIILVPLRRRAGFRLLLPTTTVAEARDWGSQGAVAQWAADPFDARRMWRSSLRPDAEQLKHETAGLAIPAPSKFEAFAVRRATSALGDPEHGAVCNSGNPPAVDASSRERQDKGLPVVWHHGRPDRACNRRRASPVR
ncbi:unnamed protein product [Symbiodinium microadriaticum]|nr:unnamed protein product [Symbiodinium microadriaticum]CAE7945345.1 unnamed protein product [Symbiodinium sp. KB8]